MQLRIRMSKISFENYKVGPCKPVVSRMQITPLGRNFHPRENPCNLRTFIGNASTSSHSEVSRVVLLDWPHGHAH